MGLDVKLRLYEQTKGEIATIWENRCYACLYYMWITAQEKQAFSPYIFRPEMRNIIDTALANSSVLKVYL